MIAKHKVVGMLLCLALLLVLVPLVAAQDDCDPENGCTAIALGVPEDVIAAYPAPAVIQLQPDDEIIYQRGYRSVTQPVDIYDAPNGNVIGTLAAGFNFVTAGGDENGWTRINPNQWVQTASLGYANVSRFSGVLLNGELPFPMAWMLVNAVPSRAPGVEPLEGDLPLLRYARINLYTEVVIDGWVWYQVGPDQWIEQRNIAMVAPIERPADVDTDRWVAVDLYEQVLIAYEGETPVFSTLVASGLPQWSTNEGTFHVYVRHERTRMSGAEGQSDFYYLEDVPWTQYFDNEIGLHGTYWHDGFGYRHSHGCVNLSIMDANWLFNFGATEFDFEVPGDEGMTVYVYSSGEYQ
jgi:lipoprotein-anchoring transpeptidase ErfK/SrfK